MRPILLPPSHHYHSYYNRSSLSVPSHPSSAMMLVHKHPILPMSPTLAHRRNPSAPPVVIVQPTRTPGLLSLSKPPRPSPPPHHQRQLHAQQRQNKAMAKPRFPPSILTQPTAADADKKLPMPAAVLTPSPQPRSRTNAKHPKEKTTNSQPRTLIRSSSHNSLRGRLSRQPSPPIHPQTRTKIPSSQAEGPINRPTQSSNLFDPFLDDAILNKPQPTLTIKPSGKLAHRRQHQPQAGNAAGAPPPSPTPGSTKAIPVPSSNPRTHTHNISRSDPALSLSHMPADLRRRSSTVGLVKFDAFPICDDMTDAGDVSDHGSAPVTPTRPKAQNKLGPSPRTAPLTGAFPLFPSAPSSAPQQKGGRRHRRSPSEGVFTMSSDEDSASSRFINPSVAALFQLARTPGAPSKKAATSPYKTPVPAAPKFARDSSPGAAMTKEKQFEKEAAEKAAGYFASSSFQNSPSPEELPDPLFM